MHTCPWLCEDFLTDGRGRPSYEMSSALIERSINEILVEACDAMQKVDFLICSGQNRRLPERDTEAEGTTWIKLHDRLAEGAVRTSRKVELPRTAKLAARSAVVEVRANTFTLKPPHTKSQFGEVTMTVVAVREIDCVCINNK